MSDNYYVPPPSQRAAFAAARAAAAQAAAQQSVAPHAVAVQPPPAPPLRPRPVPHTFPQQTFPVAALAPIYPATPPPAQYVDPSYQQPAWPGYAAPGTGYVQPMPWGGYPVPRQGNGLGTAGFVLGLLGLVLCWFPAVGIPSAVLGIVLAGCGMASGRRRNAGTGLAVAGLVLGIVALIPAVIVLAVFTTI